VLDSADQIVGFTELVVGRDGKGDGQHYGTAVLRAHRGRGLARRLKVESIRWAREDHPDLAGLLTDMVDTNVTMRRLNESLGYRTTHVVRRYMSPASR
jgi:GNAT superfamily N-acetyltransferase